MTCPGAGSVPRFADDPEGMAATSPLENHAPDADPDARQHVVFEPICPDVQDAGTSTVQPSGSVYMVQARDAGVDLRSVGATDERSSSGHAKVIGTAANAGRSIPGAPARRR